MLRALKQAFTGSNGTAVPPLQGTLYAIGDVHGEAAKVQALLEKIGADAAQFEGPVTFIGLGDYINRSGSSREVLAALRTLPSSWNTRFLRGNHEAELFKFLKNPKAHGAWLGWGGIATCQSYGVVPYGAGGLRDVGALAAELQHALEECGDFAWLQATQLYHQAGDYTFVHAGVRPGIPLSQQLENDLLFIREDWLGRPHGLSGVVVFGHTIFPEPLILPDRIGLDTGAFQGGPLSAVRLRAGEAPVILQAF